MTIYKLGEIATVEISGVDKKIKDGEIPVKLCNFVDVYYKWAITSDLEQKFMEATARTNEIERFKLKRGQVALTKDSETRFDIGIATYIADDFDNVILGYHNALITPNPEKLSGKYLNALLHTDYARTYFANNASGSGQRYALSIDALNNFPVPLIPLAEQERIGDIFSSIDQKIALNRAINDNLEAMAKQLYDYWFVQFDFPNEEGKPYKSSGGKMVWNDKLKREIPEGWEVKTIGTFADVKRGSTNTKAQTVEGDIKVVAAATDYSFLHNEANRSAYVITVSASGANAGFINFWREPIFASDCSTIQCEKIEETLYCYYWILHFQELLFTQQIGAAQPHVYPEHINKIPIVVPSPDILAKVKNLLVKSNQKQSEISREIESLTKQRDELLPLLMNGQVSVNYHLSLLEVAVNIGKFSYFIGLFLPSACRFEVDSPSSIFDGRGIRLQYCN